MVRKQAAKRKMRVYEENIDLEGETVDKVIEARGHHGAEPIGENKAVQ